MLKESEEQALFVSYCQLKGIKVVAIPNGFYAGRMGNKFAYINSMKKQGLAKGFVDLLVLAKNSKYDLLFLEFKKEKGGRLSNEQEWWQDYLNNNGYYARVACGCAEAVKILEEYLQI